MTEQQTSEEADAELDDFFERWLAAPAPCDDGIEDGSLEWRGRSIRKIILRSLRRRGIEDGTTSDLRRLATALDVPNLGKKKYSRADLAYLLNHHGYSHFWDVAHAYL